VVGRCAKQTESNSIVRKHCNSNVPDILVNDIFDLMMNKIRISIVLIGLLILGACSRTEKKEPAVNDLPPVTITLLNGTSVNLKTLEGNVMLVLFFPDCDHCQRESAAIQQHLAKFKSYTLYFLSTAPTTEIETFSRDYKLNGYDNVHFGVTTVQEVLDNFGAVATPSVYLYANGMKTKVFNGETAIEEILKSL